MNHSYEIRIKGQLDLSCAAWFDQLTITHEDNGDTVLAGDLPDQAALHGVLRKVRDLGITLISVNPVEISPGDSEGDGNEP